MVVFDEARDLLVNYAFELFKKVWNTCDIKIVFTGSMVGLIAGLLEPTPGSPLYRRRSAKNGTRVFYI